ncbi:MAG: sulfite exporter TauE/SafE family protein [Agriterribacter sp.]
MKQSFMEIAGYLAAALIGLSLGLTGGGGSILTLPVLVYLFRIQPVYATSYSLFIVGFTSLSGAFTNYLKGFVHLRTVLVFGLSSFVTVFVIRKWLVPAIPVIIKSANGFTITSASLTMMLFAILMIITAIGMLYTRRTPQQQREAVGKTSIVKLTFYSILTGLVTGLLGAGGGFLLIPVLVLVVKLPMKRAVGTSLLIIAINSLIGFAGDTGHFIIDWKKLLLITTSAIAGIFAGTSLAHKISPQKLKKIFGWFVLAMGVVMLIKEVTNQLPL